MVRGVSKMPHPLKHIVSLLVNKQINDKERVAAAMENSDLLHLVEECIRDS